MSLSIPLYSLPNNAVRVVIGVLYKSDFDSLKPSKPSSSAASGDFEASASSARKPSKSRSRAAPVDFGASIFSCQKAFKVPLTLRVPSYHVFDVSTSSPSWDQWSQDDSLKISAFFLGPVFHDWSHPMGPVILPWDQICFSTCSTKSKLLIKSMKLRVPCIKLDLRNGLLIELSIYAKYSVMNPTRFTDLEKLTPCQLSTPGRLTFISMPSVRDFLNHFMCIFNRDSIDITFGSRETCIYTLASISMTFEKLRIGYLNIADVYEEELMFEIITRFSSMNNFFLGRDTARLEPDVSVAGFERLKKVFIGNLTKINLRPNIPLDLSTLLIMNGIDISAARPRISNKDLNTFLKLWMGGSNSRLEMLSLYYPRPEGEQSILDENVILKLIKHTKQPISLRRQFQPEHYKSSTAFRRLKGGYDISNRNGIFATINITRQCFTMYVWSSTNTFNVDDIHTDPLFELYERFL